MEENWEPTVLLLFANTGFCPKGTGWSPVSLSFEGLQTDNGLKTRVFVSNKDAFSRIQSNRRYQ